MTEPKKPLTETAIDRKVDAKLKALMEAQAKIDAAQDARLARPSRMQKAVTASLDITEKYPVAAWIAGMGFVAGGVALLEGAKLWIMVAIGVCLVPGLARKVVSLIAGVKKAKGSD